MNGLSNFYTWRFFCFFEIIKIFFFSISEWYPWWDLKIAGLQNGKESVSRKNVFSFLTLPQNILEFDPFILS